LSRIHHQARLAALSAFYTARLEQAPEGERGPFAAKIAALDVAAKRPANELPMIMFLARRHPNNRIFLVGNLPAAAVSARADFDL
jgi:hypothetical protein